MKRLLILVVLWGLVGTPIASAQGPRVPLTPQNATSIEALAKMGNGTAYDIAWSPDGSTVSIAGGRGIWFYDVGNLDEPLYTIDRNSVPVRQVEYSADGTLLAWCDSKSLSVSNMNTGMILWESESAQCYRGQVAFSPDGVWLATHTTGESIQIWNVASGTLTHELQNPGGTRRLAFLPDGTLVSGDWEGWFHWWNVQDGIDFRTTQVMVDIIAVSPEGDVIATTEHMGGEIVLWDTATGQPIGTLQGWASQLFFAPGHKLLGMSEAGSLLFWITDTGEEVIKNEYHDSLVSCRSLSVSPDWQTLALTCAKGVVFFDMSSREPRQVLETFSGIPADLAFSPDSTLLASADSSSPVARLWHAGYGRQLVTLWTGTENGSDVVFSPDGSLLGTSTYQGMLQWWRTRDGTADAVLAPDESSYWHAEISPDGTILALARWKPMSAPPLLQLWDLGGERLVYELSLGEEQGWIGALAFSPDGSRLAVNAQYKYVYIIDTHRGTVEQVLGPYDDYLADLAFSGDGTILAFLAVKYSNSITVHLWNTAFDVEMGTLDPVCGEWGTVSLAISPVSNLVAVGCGDGTIWLGDIGQGTYLTTLYGQYDDIGTMAFSADGTLLASGSYDGTIWLWGSR